MRILLINKYHFLKGGAERAYFDMARMLEERGHTVAFFSMHHPENRPTAWEKYFVENIEYQDRTLSIWEKSILAGKILFNFEAHKKLEKLIEDFHPDIAHLHNIYHQLSPAIFWPLKKHRIPVVMTLHDYKLVSPNYNLFVRGKIWEHTSGIRCLIDRCVKDSFFKSLVCAMEQWLHRCLRSYGAVDRFIAPSRFLIEKYHSLGFRSEISFLPNPLLSASVPTDATGREANTFLFFGRLSSEKGVDTLLETWALLGKEQKLWIVGDGPERKKLERLTREKNMMDRVSFLGALYGTELEILKRRVQAVIIPSVWYENFPYTVIESLQSGCVVLATERGGMTERIIHGVNGFLFPASDSHALKDLIEKLPSLSLEPIRVRAAESVSDLTAENFLRELLKIYASLMRPSSR